MAARGIPYKQIGLQNLTQQRTGRPIPVPPGGNLNDYVPFYFCPRSVMLFNIHTGRVPTYTEGQEPIIYFVTTVGKVVEDGHQIAFTDRHAKMTVAHFSNDPADLPSLDWPTIQSNDFAHRPDDPERKDRKAAEFLVHRFVPLASILGIGVYSQRWKDDCERRLADAGMEMRVKVHPGWYF
jgi:ssDNA thymidine ADP-ribosyltransferase, DarT